MKKMEMITKLALVLMVTGMMTVGCSTLELHPGGSAYPAVAKRGDGPPAHAPAHGYRAKHPTHDVEMTYDSNIGVYVIVEHDNVYFHDGLYFHWSSDSWYVSATLTNWRVASATVVPKGLKGKYKQKRAKKAKKAKKH